MRIILRAIPHAFDANTCDCVLPRRKNSEHTRDSFRGKCSMIVPSFLQPQRIDRKSFCEHQRLPNCRGTYFSMYVVVANVISFEKLLSPYVLPDFYVVKFSC